MQSFKVHSCQLFLTHVSQRSNNGRAKRGWKATYNSVFNFALAAMTVWLTY